MAGLNQQPQVAQAPRDPSAQGETLETLPPLRNLRNLRDPVPGLVSDLVNFARLVQVLENSLASDLWATSGAESEQGGTSDAESEPTPVPVTPVAEATEATHSVPESSTPPKKVRRLS